ncbi:hypothetical protein FS837_012280 [Tulasnella sp. UAMH 9824]|nr:hypothetical protein FS837_012280 [Tulasnella sp. UAMH 9824]
MVPATFPFSDPSSYPEGTYHPWTERHIDPDIRGKTAASTAVTLDVKATDETDEPRETSTGLTKPVVEPASRAETAPHAATVDVATTDATSAHFLTSLGTTAGV